MLLQTNSTFLCNENYCPILFYPFTPFKFHQGGVLYMLGVASIRGQLLLEERRHCPALWAPYNCVPAYPLDNLKCGNIRSMHLACEGFRVDCVNIYIEILIFNNTI